MDQFLLGKEAFDLMAEISQMAEQQVDGDLRTDTNWKLSLVGRPEAMINMFDSLTIFMPHRFINPLITKEPAIH